MARSLRLLFAIATIALHAHAQAPATNMHQAHYPSFPLTAPPPPGPPGSIVFNSSFGSDMVLQQSPAQACVYGLLGAGGSSASVKISSTEDASFSAYKLDATLSDGGQWKACLKPAQAGGSYQITATCSGCTNSTPAVLDRVTFGDVWYCGGQSNMALPLVHTLTRNTSRDNIKAGKYSNIRIFGVSGNMNPDQPWSTLKDALNTDPDSDKSALMGYSSTCYYFGESLTDELSKSDKVVPIGLIHTAWGGSTIEQWLDNKTISECSNVSLSAANGEWHDSRVLPFTSMTLKGWVWYQGENDMHGTFGNSVLHTGYSCMMPKLIASWRSLWATTPSTTPSDAPFGLVALPPSGSEGGSDIGTMRWAQTAGYGVVPNPAMPNAFLAQAYDLDDPWGNISCYKITGCPSKPEPAGGWGGCQGYCDSLAGTNYYMGPIHPRDKRPVGQRLAGAAVVVAYGAKGHASGPTLAGCSKNGNSIAITFNASLMSQGSQDKLVVQPYNVKAGASKMHVLVNASLWCMQTGNRGDSCIDDGTGKPAEGSAFDSATTWVAVDISVSANAPNVLNVDLTKTGGVAFGIRYAWQGDCCSENPPTDGPCPIASCPIMASPSKLPANPFMAKIVNNKCSCIAPQVCDA